MKSAKIEIHPLKILRRIMNENTSLIDGYACPVDPQDAMNCDSCQ
jgi:hypothetical protein